MLTSFRLAWRLQRFELRLLLGACLLVLLGGLLVTWQIRAVRTEELACSPAAVDACLAIASRREPFEAAAQILHGIGAVAPFVLGLFLGIPIVAREIEGGTGSLAWSLSRGRRSWLIGRAAPVLAFVVVGSAMVAIAGEVLTHAMPWAEGAEIGFADYAMRGSLVVVRAVEVFAIALALGALVARQLPAMLIAGLVTFAVLAGIQLNMDAVMAREAVPLDPQAMQQGAYPKIFGSALRDDATGQLTSYDDYFQAHPAAASTGNIPSGFTHIQFGIAGSRYGEFALRESAMLAIAGVVASALAFVVVQRRTPY